MMIYMFTWCHMLEYIQFLVRYLYNEYGILSHKLRNYILCEYLITIYVNFQPEDTYIYQQFHCIRSSVWMNYQLIIGIFLQNNMFIKDVIKNKEILYIYG